MVQEDEQSAAALLGGEVLGKKLGIIEDEDSCQDSDFSGDDPPPEKDVKDDGKGGKGKVDLM